MKVLKKILIAIVVVVLLAVVVSFFLPSNITISRSAVINAPIEVVYAQANNLEKFHAWDPWSKIDPNAEFTFGETVAGVGASQSWKSEHPQVGNGKMTIVEAIPFEKVVTKLEFGESGDAGMGGFDFEEVEGGTKVNWSMSMEFGMNPIARIMGTFMDAMVGPTFEKGLADMSANALAEEMVGDITMSEALKCVTIRQTITSEEMATIHGVLYGKLVNFMKKKEVEEAGMPLAIYHSFNEDMIDIECAIPVANEVEPTDEINVIDLPTQKVAKFVHMGDYANLTATYEKAEQWMNENGVETNGAPWEIYVTDPEETTDISQWKTEVYYPVN